MVPRSLDRLCATKIVTTVVSFQRFVRLEITHLRFSYERVRRALRHMQLSKQPLNSFPKPGITLNASTRVGVERAPQGAAAFSAWAERQLLLCDCHARKIRNRRMQLKLGRGWHLGDSYQARELLLYSPKQGRKKQTYCKTLHFFRSFHQNHRFSDGSPTV